MDFDNKGSNLNVTFEIDVSSLDSFWIDRNNTDNEVSRLRTDPVYRRKAFLRASEIATDTFKQTLSQAELGSHLFDHVWGLVVDWSDHYLLHHSEDEQFETELNVFKQDLANCRYESGREFMNKVAAFVKKLELRDSDYSLSKKQTQMKAIEKIIGLFPDALDFSIGFMINAPGEKKVNKRTNELNFSISMKDLQRTYEVTSNRLIENIAWFEEISEKLLTPFLDMPASRRLIGPDPRELLEKTKELGVFFKSQNLENVECRADLIAQQQSSMISIHNYIFRLCKAGSVARTATEENRAGPLSEAKCTIDQINKVIKIFKNRFGAHSGVVGSIGVQYTDSPEVNFWVTDLDNLIRHLEFSKACQQVHILFDTYIHRPVFFMKALVQKFHDWSAEIDKKKTDIYDPWQEIIPLLEAQSEESELPASEEIILSDQDKGKTSKSRNKGCSHKRKGHSNKKTVSSSAQNEKRQTQAKEVISKTTAPLELSPFQYMENFLSHLRMIEQSNDFKPLQTIALKQTVLSLESALWAAKSSPMDSTLFTQLTRDCYQASEQILRLHVLAQEGQESDASHDLKKKMKKIGSAEKIDKHAVSLFQGGYLWVQSGYSLGEVFRSIRGRQKELVMPKYLGWVLESWEAGHSNEGLLKERSVEMLSTLVELFRPFKTFALMERLSAQSPVEDVRVGIEMNWDQEALKTFSRELQVYLSKQNFSPRNPALLKFLQTERALLQLQQSMKRLSVPVVLANDFAYDVRNIVYWLQNVGDSFFQGLSLSKNRKVFKGHELEEFYSNLVKEPGAEKLTFLREYFAHVYYDIRYPFEYKQARSKLHETFLIAKSLKDYPEVLKGFQVQGGSSKLTKDSPKEIHDELIRGISELLTIMREVLAEA